MLKLAIVFLFGVVWGGRLDNTYLPPGGAKTAGGNGNLLKTPFANGNGGSVVGGGVTPISGTSRFGSNIIGSIGNGSFRKNRPFNRVYEGPGFNGGKSAAPISNGAQLSPEYGAPVITDGSVGDGTSNGLSSAYGAPVQSGIPLQNTGSRSSNALSSVYGVPGQNGIPISNTGIGSSNGLSSAYSVPAQNGIPVSNTGIGSSNGLSSAYGVPAQNGIPVSNIGTGSSNGISSAYGVPAQNGIPVSNTGIGSSNGLSSAYGVPAQNGIPSGRYSGPKGVPANILRYNSENDGTGIYRFDYETENHISQEERGDLKNVGTNSESSVVQGTYSYAGPDGRTYTVNYIADENGFQPTGDHIHLAVQAAAADAARTAGAEGNVGGYSSGGQYQSAVNAGAEGNVGGYSPEGQYQSTANGGYRY